MVWSERKIKRKRVRKREFVSLYLKISKNRKRKK